MYIVDYNIVKKENNNKLLLNKQFTKKEKVSIKIRKIQWVMHKSVKSSSQESGRRLKLI